MFLESQLVPNSLVMSDISDQMALMKCVGSADVQVGAADL
jgi:hypothetical protein